MITDIITGIIGLSMGNVQDSGAATADDTIRDYHCQIITFGT
jgi:hypothetical protein